MYLFEYSLRPLQHIAAGSRCSPERWVDMTPPAHHPAGDIRQYLSPARAPEHVIARSTPQPTPVRRRIIHDSDDSDHAQEPHQPVTLPVVAGQAPVHNDVQDAPPHHHLSGGIRPILSPARASVHAIARSTPQPTPERCRTVTDAVDSDHAHEFHQPDTLPVPAGPASELNVVQVADDASEDDDIWVAPIERPTESDRAQAPHAALADLNRAPLRRNPTRSAQQSVGGCARLTPNAPVVDRNRVSRTDGDRSQPVRRSRSCFEAEAEEVDDESESSSVDESDEDAVDLYRSAIMGVRNRPNALQQVRASTTPCAACALFAKFLRYFV